MYVRVGVNSLINKYFKIRIFVKWKFYFLTCSAFSACEYWSRFWNKYLVRWLGCLSFHHHQYPHHHHVVQLARISLTLSCHPSLSSIAPGWSSRLHSVFGTELLKIGSSWSSNLCSFVWGGPQESNVYGFVLTSPVVSRDVMVMVVGNGHGDTSSNPRRDWLHFI